MLVFSVSHQLTGGFIRCSSKIRNILLPSLSLLFLCSGAFGIFFTTYIEERSSRTSLTVEAAQVLPRQ